MNLANVPKDHWPIGMYDARRIEVWQNSAFLVQVFDEGMGVVRITVNRTKMKAAGKWRDGISWDELMNIKRLVGFGGHFAVECYPEDANIVNVSNMRHLFVMPERLWFAWKK